MTRFEWDWDAIQERAYYVGIRPDEFWRMTPKEVDWMVNGYFWRLDHQGMMHANFTSAIARAMGGKVKPKDLYQPILQPKKPNRAGRYREIIRQLREATEDGRR